MENGTPIFNFPFTMKNEKWEMDTKFHSLRILPLKLSVGLMVVQCAELERAVAVRVSNNRPVNRLGDSLPDSASLPGSGVGRQQIHQETTRAARHRQQRTSWLLVACAFWPRTGQTQLESLDFVINSFFPKLFTTKSIETVKYCQEYFDFSLPGVLWAKRLAKFEVSFECFCLCFITVWLRLYCLLFVVYHVCLVRLSYNLSHSPGHSTGTLRNNGQTELL